MKKTNKLVSFILLSCLLTIFLFPNGAFAEMNSQNELHNNIDKILDYIVIDDDGRITFDEDAAELNNESAEIIQIGIDTELIAEAYYIYEHQNFNSRVEGLPPIPIHGNWCGPSYGEGNGDPIDALDACCKWHDECYGDFGDFACRCDQGIIDMIDENYASMGLLERQKASAVAAFFMASLIYHGCL